MINTLFCAYSKVDKNGCVVYITQVLGAYVFVQLVCVIRYLCFVGVCNTIHYKYLSCNKQRFFYLYKL